MKYVFLAFFLIYLSSFTFAQQSYTFNGETLILEMEVEGDLDLLLLEKEKGYRFFVKDKNENIVELINTRDVDSTYFNQYRDTLRELTKDSNMYTKEVGFNKYSIKKFIKAYNAQGSKRYAYTDERVSAQARLGIFGGVTNHPLIPNPDNITTPFADIELEIFEKKELPRQSGFISIEQTFKEKGLDYTSTIIALGYRFRFINKPKYNIYSNLQFATYTFSKRTVLVENEEPEESYLATTSDSAFRVPFILGIGTDIKVSDTSYISLIYNELISAFVSNNGNFPINVSLGYKFNI